MAEDRADVIIPAMNIIIEIMSLVNCENLYLPKVGLKEGILLSKVKPTPVEFHYPQKGV
jgi:exopolyphosphatase/guanosine-5'-triphosphate,3'-diphosphate pyrophosphatase